MKFKTVFLSVMAIGLGLLVGGQGVTAQAQTNVRDVLPKAPQGVSVTDYFTAGEIGSNSAVLAKTGYGADKAVQLTNTTGQLGTIWTKDDSEMSLDSDQTAAMWMYFGNGNSGSGDGMAFVMQNDDRGIKASTTNAAGEPIGGETLGVWGTDQDDTMSDADAVAKTGIQKSWALEFDTFRNNIPDSLNKQTGQDALGKGSSFDIDDALNWKNAHIASGFPGSGSTYNMHTVPVSTTEKVQTGTFWGQPIYTDVTTTTNHYYATMNHTQPIEGRTSSWLVDGAWYHVTLKWNAANETMTYIFDDKDATTGAAKANPATKTVSVPKSTFGTTDKVRWGFTGSTGSNWEPNIVIFEQVPGIVNANSTAEIKDETDQKTVTSGATVGGGHSMRVTYNLSYTGGSQNWKDIQANLNLPANIDYTDGTIEYGDSTLPVTKLSKEEIESGTLTLPVKELSKTNPTATITLNGDAKAGSTTELANKFVGSNALTDARTPAFTVTAPSKTGAFHMAWTGDSTSGSTTVAPKTDVPVTAQLSYEDGSVVDNSSTVIHPVIDGAEQQPIPLKATDTPGTVSYDVPQDKLTSGQPHTLKLYAEDGYGRISDKISYKITVKAGSLDMSVPTGATFKQTTLTGSTQFIQPSDDFKVSVSDTRGTNNDWTLYAKSTTFASVRMGVLPGRLIYKQGSDVSDLTAGFVKIKDRTTESDNDVTDITQGWDANNGLLLEVQGNTIGGPSQHPELYGGEITWSFSDTPENSDA
ncbi:MULTISPECIES: hypothetical protein [Lactobacillaceae]|uniref:lectin-like domain-containing protein n=1 Tax=Lactobacillaceae TaxID=33958 RepID=UPI00145661EA|nr:hypothetical protein [Lactobacillus sp. HBUAS51381]NLR08917.1 hypothetical protein [Lactobacillus sp. HBUAS51381]